MGRRANNSGLAINSHPVTAHAHNIGYVDM